VVIDEDTVGFRNELLRLAAYEGLSVRRRRAVHRRAGEVLDEWGDEVPVDDPVAARAFHASGSGIPERIVHSGTEAAEVAIGKGAMEIAEGLLHDVVVAQRRLGIPEESRCATHRRLAFAAERAGHPEAALDALREGASLAEQQERASIAVDRARLLEKLGRYRAALALTARAIKTDPDPEVGRRLLLSRATIKNFQGRWGECLELCHSILDDETWRDPNVAAQAHLLAEWCCACLGRPERSEHEEAALALFTEVGDSIGLANLYLNRGISAWQESRVTDAIDDFRRGSDHYLTAGDVVGAALADNNVAEILTLQSRLDEAEVLLDHAHRVLLAASYPLGTVITRSGLARIAAWRGRGAEALELQTDSLREFRELDSQDHVVEALVRLVEIHVLAGEAAAAAALDAAAEARRALEGDGDVPVLPAT
jgi:tetratricopeptide (TPR) repeat protein